MEITLDQLLASREERASFQKELLKGYPGKTLVCLTVIMPGKVKRNLQSLVVAQAAVIGVATPSDASAVLGGAARREVGAIELPDWTAPTAPSGSGGPKGLGEVELWRVRQEITRAGRLVVDQKTAPESVVIVPGAGGLTSLTLTWSRDTWFYQALVLTAAGALLTTVGGLLLRPGPRRPTITEVSR